MYIYIYIYIYISRQIFRAAAAAAAAVAAAEAAAAFAAFDIRQNIYISDNGPNMGPHGYIAMGPTWAHKI
jgi:hypothetical protein